MQIPSHIPLSSFTLHLLFSLVNKIKASVLVLKFSHLPCIPLMWVWSLAFHITVMEEHRARAKHWVHKVSPGKIGDWRAWSKSWIHRVVPKTKITKRKLLVEIISLFYFYFSLYAYSITFIKPLPRSMSCTIFSRRHTVLGVICKSLIYYEYLFFIVKEV